MMKRHPFFLSLALLSSPLAAQVGGTWEQLHLHLGPTDNSEFGAAITSHGDLNGDGWPEYLSTAPLADNAHNGPIGRAYIYSGIDGSLFREHAGVSFGGKLGTAAANLGDVNGDGINDYCLGTPFEGTSYTRPGSVTTYSGATGTQLWQTLGDGNYWHFGSVLQPIGDLNGDHIPDLLVGIPQAHFGSYTVGQGAVNILSGADGSTFKRIRGTEEFDFFGSSLAAPGDLDGDGYPDFLVGSRGVDNHFQGIVRLYSGANFAKVLTLGGDSYSATAKGFGYTMSGIGDWDRDGTPDIAIAAPSEELPGYLTNAGVVRITPAPPKKSCKRSRAKRLMSTSAAL